MDYHSLLQEDQWKVKCLTILERDHFICQDCHIMGIHSTYFPINNIEDIEGLFPDILFSGNRLSDFLTKCYWDGSVKTSIRTSSKHIDNKIFFSELDNCGIGNTYKFISDYRISEIHYRVFSNDIQIYYANKIMSGRIVAFNIEENISNSNYVSIKHHLGEKSPLYETVEISIFYNNKLYYLDFSHLNIDDKPMFNFTQLHIHHKYYIKGKKPWEYDNEALVTLCADCHQKRHQTSNIPMFSSTKELLKSNLPICDRCQGRGYIPQYYYHCEGICFKCFGEGVCDL